MTKVSLDYSNMLATRLSEGGVTWTDLEGPLSHRFAEVYARVQAAEADGTLGFMALGEFRAGLAEIQAVADSFGQWFENLVVLGIGGSALGTRTVADAILGPLWNQGEGDSREHFPRLFVLENVDPESISDLLNRLDLRRTLFNVVSKSGSTAETMAQFLVVAERLREEMGEEAARGHLLFTTDPERGSLRELAEAEGIPTLAVPPNVGGRFSVLSPVGLFPAAATGVRVEALLEGAQAMAARCRTPNLLENPAGMLAVLLHRAHVEDGKGIHVLMPYSDRLRTLGLWFQQLWGESLGKIQTTVHGPVSVGPTPLPALGATDQHSQLQLFMEGPADKVVMFISQTHASDPLAIPHLYQGQDAMGYLGGHTLKELLDVERSATAEALRRQGRPNLHLELPKVNEESLGELLYLFQLTTVMAGFLYQVDPLDQPGVELGKVLTYGLMGRPGYPVPELDGGDPRAVV